MRTLASAMLALAMLAAPPAALHAQAPAQPPPASAGAGTPAPFVVEYYYKARWGSFDEFRTLFRKNHYPVLLEEQALGRIVRLAVDYPVYHGTEDGRWDMRVTIVWKSAATTFDGFDSAPILKELYPDQETFRTEEQRRFELLEAHWDLPLRAEDLTRW